MKNICLILLIIASSLVSALAHNGDTTCTENCKNITKEVLTGEWAYTNFAYKIVDRVHDCGNFITADNIYLRFSFDANGSYTMSYGSGEAEHLEIGTWDVSSDAESIVLFANKNAEPQFIKIGNIEDETVELELNIEASNLSDLFCTQMNVLNFSKNIVPTSKSIIR